MLKKALLKFIAINQKQDGQGFSSHITAAHTMHILSSTGEADPDFAIAQPDGRRRPMVQRAFENYEVHRKSR